MYLNRFKIKFNKGYRVGRGYGSGVGRTCKRGHKGQKARSGYAKKKSFEGGQTPLHIRLPKFGFKSYKKKNKIEITTKMINLFNKNYLNLSILKKHKIIKNNIKKIKIIYSEKLKNSINFNENEIKISKKVLNDIKEFKK